MCAELLEKREEMPEKRHMRERGCVTTEQIKRAGMTHRLLNLPIVPQVAVYEGSSGLRWSPRLR